MPTKPHPLSNSPKPLVDSHRSERPAKGFKQVVARLSKPFKAFGSGSSKDAKAPAADVPNQASNKAPSPQMFAQARERADGCIARAFSGNTSDSVFSSPRVSPREDCALKLLGVRQLILDTEDQIDKLRAQLSASSTADQDNVLQIRFELLNKNKILGEAKALKTEYSQRLNEIFATELEKIQHQIDGLKTTMASSSGAKQLQLRTLIAQAELEMLNLEIARDRL